MVQSLNCKVKVVGHDNVKSLLDTEYSTVKLKLKSILKGVPYCCTADAWRSCSLTTYMTCTVHFIDHESWTLHSFCLGIFEKTSTSKAEDVVHYIEKMLSTVGLLELHTALP
jgi:hypothetical protein